MSIHCTSNHLFEGIWHLHLVLWIQANGTNGVAKDEARRWRRCFVFCRLRSRRLENHWIWVATCLGYSFQVGDISYTSFKALDTHRLCIYTHLPNLSPLYRSTLFCQDLDFSRCCAQVILSFTYCYSISQILRPPKGAGIVVILPPSCKRAVTKKNIR